MRRASDIIQQLTEAALLVILSAMAVVVFLQVIFRYVLNLPLFWTEEFARYCLVWASLLGAAVALKRGQHIAVTFVMDRLPPRLQAVLARIALLAVALLLTVITWGGIQLVLVTRAQISPALRISMSIPYAAVPAGAALMLWHTIVLILRPPRSTAAQDECRR
ncbi:MAG: TRAP transporter small permease [Desulfobacterales bacterium]|nr:MAG: TRAP transporter small permease [Desulfobacterales bacterium]